jgi:hypothetical protein
LSSKTLYKKGIKLSVEQVVALSSCEKKVIHSLVNRDTFKKWQQNVISVLFYALRSKKTDLIILVVLTQHIPTARSCGGTVRIGHMTFPNGYSEKSRVH